MLYINIVYFLVITILAWNFLTSDGKILKGALNREDQYHYSGTDLFWCLTFSTGLLAFSANVGVDLMALRLLVLEILCLVGLKFTKEKPIFSLPLKIFVVYLLWLVIGLFYSPSVPYGIRMILKYVYPLLLCLFASAAVRDSEVFFKASFWARTVGVVSLIFSFIPFIMHVIPGVFWYVTARAINYISIMIFSVGMIFFSNKKKQNIIYTILFLLPCIIWVLRTSILGSVVALMAFAFIKYKTKSLPVIVGVFALGVAAVFFIPEVKEKMFYDPNKVTLEDLYNGTIEEENIDTNFRAYMWEKLETRLYYDNPIIGSGTGAVQNEMYSLQMTPEYGHLFVPHSDFVQQKCDNGLVGLILYGAIIFFIFADCFRTYWKYSDGPLRLCAIVAGASLLGVYATFYSDNVVNYSMATLSMPFGFYGMMLGLRRSRDELTDQITTP